MLLASVAMLVVISIGASAEGGQITGMIVGRTGDILHLNVPEPVREGSVIEVRPVSSEPAVAEARILSCTNERPFIALAKIIRADADVPVPIGAYVYADTNAVDRAYAPAPMNTIPHSEDSRFSIQAGAFYPTSAYVRDATSNYWQSYQLDYSFVRAGAFDALLSAEYLRGAGTGLSNGIATSHVEQVYPLTLLGRLRPMHVGNTYLYVGAGGGIYHIVSNTTTGSASAGNTVDKFGTELTAGLESARGWILELKYRDVKDTDIQGYNLGLGARF
jgi:hypothetical protein